MLFRNANILINGIEKFLVSISQGAIAFKEGMKNYLENDEVSFQQQLGILKELEGKADDFRREVENGLYKHSLIPQYRGDVLALMENLDDVIDKLKETLYQFDVERPFIPEVFHLSFDNLTDVVCKSVDAIVLSTRKFFVDPKSVKTLLIDVYLREKEADKISLNLKRNIFSYTQFDLDQKTHLRYFTRHIDSIADITESVADRLSIYSIKQLS